MKYRTICGIAGLVVCAGAMLCGAIIEKRETQKEFNEYFNNWRDRKEHIDNYVNNWWNNEMKKES